MRQKISQYKHIFAELVTRLTGHKKVKRFTKSTLGQDGFSISHRPLLEIISSINQPNMRLKSHNKTLKWASFTTNYNVVLDP